MADIFSAISKYNIINYLIPGTIFCVLLRLLTPYDLIQPELAVGMFLYYFVGMIISRVGSVIIEPVFKKIGVVKYAPYDDYLTAMGKDPGIADLLEANNSYRTLTAMCLLLLLALSTMWAVESFGVEVWQVRFVAVLALILIFIAAYRKQTGYIRNRVELTLKTSQSESENT